jgi:serine/threonine protein kinase
MPLTDKIDRYDISDELGNGTYGMVYKASDNVLRNEVAIKQLKDQFVNDPDVVSRFKKDGQLLTGIDHPNVVKIIDYLIIDNRHYVIMEYCGNGNLEIILANNGRFDVGMAARYAREIFLGLQSAHETGVIHRDLKPTNVLQGYDGTCKITDFGLSDDTFPGSMRRYLAGGTKGYTAPEQDPDFFQSSPALNHAFSPTDHRADIFAAGTLLWQMLTNRWPSGLRQISEPNGLYPMSMTCQLPNPRQINPDIPDSWVEAISKCREISPDDRIQTMTELIDLLDLANTASASIEYKDKATLERETPIEPQTRVVANDQPGTPVFPTLKVASINENEQVSPEIDSSVPDIEDDASDGTYQVGQSDEITSGTIFPIAGRGLKGRTGDGGPSKNAALNIPSDVLIHSSGDLYIVDSGNHRIRLIENDSSTIKTIIGKNGVGFSGDGSRGDESKLNRPSKICLHPDGSVYIADSNNQRIRRVDSQTTTISTVVGIGDTNQWNDSTPASSSGIGRPTALAVAPSGTLFFCETSESTHNTVLTYQDSNSPLFIAAGLRDQNGYSGDGGPAAEALLNEPTDIAVDSMGNLYIADSKNYRIRKVDRDTQRISTVAGIGRPGTSGDGGPASIASVGIVTNIVLDNLGNLWMLDNGSDNSSGTRVRKVDALTNIITTEVGGGDIKTTSERVSVQDANLFVNGLAVDRAGNVYLADTMSHRVWKAELAA